LSTAAFEQAPSPRVDSLTLATFMAAQARKAPALNIRQLVCAAAFVAAASTPAAADLRMCNNTGGRVSVALAYTDGQEWVSEGWWNLKSLDCVTLLRGALAAQYYYVYAMDERGGEWKGKAFMCTSDREFKIEGRQDCFVRGYDRTGFFEVDTGKDAKSWTVQLTDQANSSTP
jgi:uncharacterized membrane protein